LSEELAKVSAPNLIVPLYACLTAGTPVTGFAHRLHTELVRRGLIAAKVFGHTTAGHTSRNPFVKVIDASGARWLVPPDSKEFPKWKAHLHATSSTLRLRFPFMALEEILEEIETPVPKPIVARR
jgi:hypothetical protein